MLPTRFIRHRLNIDEHVTLVVLPKRVNKTFFIFVFAVVNWLAFVDSKGLGNPDARRHQWHDHMPEDVLPEYEITRPMVARNDTRKGNLVSKVHEHLAVLWSDFPQMRCQQVSLNGMAARIRWSMGGLTFQRQKINALFRSDLVGTWPIVEPLQFRDQNLSFGSLLGESAGITGNPQLGTQEREQPNHVLVSGSNKRGVLMTEWD